MEIISDLKQRHLSGWTAALRELKPADIDKITNLPEVEFDGVTVKAAIKAGWVEGVTDPAVVDDMRGGDVAKLSNKIWKAFNEARHIDPN